MKTIHTRQLHQYTRPTNNNYTQDNYNSTHKTTNNNTYKTTNNNYTQDNLKLATKHARQIRIQHAHSKLNYKFEELHGSLILEYDVVRIAVLVPAIRRSLCLHLQDSPLFLCHFQVEAAGTDMPVYTVS